MLQEAAGKKGDEGATARTIGPLFAGCSGDSHRRSCGRGVSSAERPAGHRSASHYLHRTHAPTRSWEAAAYELRCTVARHTPAEARGASILLALFTAPYIANA